MIKLSLSLSVPEDYKKNPGAVEAIAEQPGHPDNILIGYNRGLMVLWNKATPGAQQVDVICLYVYTITLWRMQYSHAYTLSPNQHTVGQCLILLARSFPMYT